MEDHIIGKPTRLNSDSIKFLLFSLCTQALELGSTQYCDQHKWENLKGCALFSIVGLTEPVLPIAVHNR